MPKLKIGTGVLYIATALIGFRWALYLTLTELYGLPFSWWYAVIFGGALAILVGAILEWSTSWAWVRWLPAIGAGIQTAYFVPGFVFMLRKEPGLFSREPMQGLLYATVTLVVLACFFTAIRRLFCRQNGDARQESRA